MKLQNNLYIIANGEFTAVICLGELTNFGISSGDVVQIRPQPDVFNGTLALVEYDGAYIITRVHHYFEEDTIILQPGSPGHLPIIISGEEKNKFKVLGKVTEINKTLGNN